MRKFLATAAVAASAAASLVAMPSPAHAVSTGETALRICASGAPIFYRAVTQSTNTSFEGGVQNHTCQDVIVVDHTLQPGSNPVLERVRVSRLGTASSSLYCGPASEMSCQSPQFPNTEMFIDDFYGQSRLRGDNAEVTIERQVAQRDDVQPATVTFFTDTEM